MRIINYITCLVLASIVFSSCKKDEEVTPLDPNNPDLETPEPDWKLINPVTLLDQLNIDKITYSYEGGTTVTTFHYNSNGKLLKLVEYNEYTKDVLKMELETVYEFVYQNNSLIRTTRNYNDHVIFGEDEYYDEYADSLEYSYNNNGLIDQIRIVDDGHEDKIVTREYDIHNRLIKQVISNGLEILTNYYEWDGNNIVKATEYSKILNDVARKLSFSPLHDKMILSSMSGRIKAEDQIHREYFYTEYDNKNNPLCFMSIIKVHNINEYLPQNNVVNVSIKLYYLYDDHAGELAGEWSNEYSYEYNNNDQVTKTFTLYNGIGTARATMSIEYK